MSATAETIWTVRCDRAGCREVVTGDVTEDDAAVREFLATQGWAVGDGSVLSGDFCPEHKIDALALAERAQREARPQGLMPLPKYTCGLCGETFGTNFAVDEITCANCEARRCPHCGRWFGSEE